MEETAGRCTALGRSGKNGARALQSGDSRLAVGCKRTGAAGGPAVAGVADLVAVNVGFVGGVGVVFYIR